MVIEFITRSDLPVFLIVRVRGADAPPAFTDPRLTDLGLTWIFGVIAAFAKKGKKMRDTQMARIKKTALPSAFILSAVLPDIIDAHSGRDQGRHIGPALQVTHMTPLLDNDPVGLYLEATAALVVRDPPESFMVFIRIGAQELCEIRVDQSIPGYAEDDTGWRNVFPHRGRTGFDFLDRKAIVDRFSTLHG
jgi:hypothetical protein